MTYNEYNRIHEEIKPYFIEGKRLAESEWKWLEKKEAIRREKVTYVNSKGESTSSFHNIIIDIPKFRILENTLDEFNRCEYGKQKRLEAIEA